jgi:hypothetical protein
MCLQRKERYINNLSRIKINTADLFGPIEKTNEKRHISAHRSPAHYKFNEKAYKKALQEMLVLV